MRPAVFSRTYWSGRTPQSLGTTILAVIMSVVAVGTTSTLYTLILRHILQAKARLGSFHQDSYKQYQKPRSSKSNGAKSNDEEQHNLAPPGDTSSPLALRISSTKQAIKKEINEIVDVEIELCRKFVIVAAVTFIIDSPLAGWILYELCSGLQAPPIFALVALSLTILQPGIDGKHFWLQSSLVLHLCRSGRVEECSMVARFWGAFANRSPEC